MLASGAVAAPTVPSRSLRGELEHVPCGLRAGPAAAPGAPAVRLPGQDYAAVLALGAGPAVLVAARRAAPTAVACLGEVLGEQVWREVGIGGPDDSEQLKARITTLEQQVVDLELKFQEQGDDLHAARTTIPELMAQLNRDPARRH